MDKIHALRALTLGAVLVGGVGVYLYESNRFAAEPSGPCDPIPTTTASLLDYSATLRGGERSIQKLTLVARTSAMVFLVEQGGMDDVLEVFDADGKIQGRADSPIRRTGIQRVLLSNESANAVEYRLEALAKEGKTLTGQLQMRAIALPTNPQRDACLNVQLQLAQADAAYAAGMVANTKIKLAAGETKPADAPAQFKLATDTYIKVAEQLVEYPSLLLAQARHAASAVLYQELSDWTPAREWADRAIGSYEQQQDVYGRVRALAMSAAAQMEIAVNLAAPDTTSNASHPSSLALTKVREQLEALIALHRERGETYDEALALNNLGLAYWYDGLNEQAIVSYQQVWPLYASLHETYRQAQSLNNLALAEYDLGRIVDANQHYQQALQLVSVDDNPSFYAALNANKAITDMDMGELDVATKELLVSIKIHERLQETWWQAASLLALGDAYQLAGDHDRALHYYEQTLAIGRSETTSRQRATVLRKIANILRAQGKAADALSKDEDALSLEPNPYIRTSLRIAIATDYDALKNYESAERELNTAHNEAKNPWIQRKLNLRRGQHYLAINQPDKALQDLRTAASAFKEQKDPEYELYAIHSMAQAQRALGDTKATLQDLDRALMLAEQLRQQSSNPVLRATTLQLARPVFDSKIQLLADQYLSRNQPIPDSTRNALLFNTLQTAEQSRARALEDYQRLDTALIDKTVLQQRQALLHQLTAQRKQLTQRLEAGSDSPLVDALKRGIADTRTQLDQLDAQIATQSGLGQQSLRSVNQFQEILKKLPTDVAVIEYWMGEERTLAWVLSRSMARLLDLGPTQPITDATLSYYTALRNTNGPQTQRLTLSRQLYDLLIRPLHVELNNKRQLVFAPDGALHYLPFAMLLRQDGSNSRFLVQDYDISLTPALSLWLDKAPIKRNIDQRMLLVADPVYQPSDERLASHQPATRSAISMPPLFAFRSGEDIDNLQRLPGTAREASAIAKLMDGKDVNSLQGLAANRERFLDSGLEKYRYIHIASHAFVDADIPQLSSLVLSTRDVHGQFIEGQVTAADLITTSLTAEVVVLSACETALGQNVSGEGLMGLNYIMLARGARSVIASLWQVPDEASARLMARFYERLLKHQEPVASALSVAMREILATDTTDTAVGAFVVTTQFHNIN